MYLYYDFGEEKYDASVLRCISRLLVGCGREHQSLSTDPVTFRALPTWLEKKKEECNTEANSAFVWRYFKTFSTSNAR